MSISPSGAISRKRWCRYSSVANTTALVGFGLDSIVEFLSGMVLIGRLRKHGTVTQEKEERIERKAMRFAAVIFFIIGGSVPFESLRKLVTGEQPDPSLPGMNKLFGIWQADPMVGVCSVYFFSERIVRCDMKNNNMKDTMPVQGEGS